jgi:molybdate transport system substrate-binding protein
VIAVPNAFPRRAVSSFLSAVFAIGAYAFLVLGSARAQNGELRIAAAADLNFAMDELVRQYKKRIPAEISVTYGSSGNFFAQIQNGAPFDLFFSADIDYPKKLEAAGLAAPGTVYEYAVGRIVIWMPEKADFDLARLGWKALLLGEIQKIAIANPEHAPYGRAAVAALQNAGIYEQIRGKLVYGENISQAAQFVQSGNAQAGIVALSLAISTSMKGGRSWEIPVNSYPPIEQGAVILKGTRDKEAARAFMVFVKSDVGRKILERNGLTLPSTPAANSATH